MSTERPVRVAFYGLFGVGNLGNEGSLAVVLDHLKRLRSDVEFVSLCGDPEATEAQHGIPSTRLTVTSRPAPGALPDKVWKVLGRLLDVPRTFRLVGQVDVVVVPGMGVLEEQIGVRPWGLPYWLFLLAAACRIRRRPLVLISVGVDEVADPMTRQLFRWTVRNAAYVSFRDDYSRACASSLGLGPDPGSVEPDVAFGLPRMPPGHRRPGTVAVGVITYYGVDDDPSEGKELRARYLDTMAQFVETLLVRGRNVRLLVGDRVDQLTVQDIFDMVSCAQPELSRDRLSFADVSDLPSLVREMTACDAVVASRFHNIVCALAAVRPTVSVAYAPKNTDLMRSVGMSRYCQDIPTLDLESLLRQLQEVESRWIDLRPGVVAAVDSFRDRTSDQLDLVCTRIDIPCARDVQTS